MTRTILTSWFDKIVISSCVVAGTIKLTTFPCTPFSTHARLTLGEAADLAMALQEFIRRSQEVMG